MDDGERILSHGPRPALDDFPSLRMGMRVERLGRSAHVALAGELSGALRHHVRKYQPVHRTVWPEATG